MIGEYIYELTIKFQAQGIEVSTFLQILRDNVIALEMCGGIIVIWKEPQEKTESHTENSIESPSLQSPGCAPLVPCDDLGIEAGSRNWSRLSEALGIKAGSGNF